MNRFGSNKLIFKYQRFTLSGCKIHIRKFEFVAKTQFFPYNAVSKVSFFVGKPFCKMFMKENNYFKKPFI